MQYGRRGSSVGGGGDGGTGDRDESGGDGGREAEERV